MEKLQAVIPRFVDSFTSAVLLGKEVNPVQVRVERSECLASHLSIRDFIRGVRTLELWAKPPTIKVAFLVPTAAGADATEPFALGHTIAGDQFEWSPPVPGPISESWTIMY